MRVLKIIGNIIKWIIIILLTLFSFATFFGNNYGQTIVLILIASALAYWPNYVRKKWNETTSFLIRTVFIAILIALNTAVFKSASKSIYTSEENKQQLMELYDIKQSFWPQGTREIYIDTKYGRVHLLTCGAQDHPPLVMLHAASMGAHSWAENLNFLLNNYCIYAIDNIGEGNKSQLYDALTFPQTEKEIADLYASLLDSLSIERAPVFGASNGGYIAQVLAYYYPEKVESLVLFAPMGLTQLTNGSVFMMAVATMYPLQSIRGRVTKWAIGEDQYCNDKYGDWFNAIMKGTIPSIGKPIPMTIEQKRDMKMPVLLFIGTQDKIVGVADHATSTAEEYPNIQIEVLKSGHLIAVEHRDYVNQKVKAFLNRL